MPVMVLASSSPSRLMVLRNAGVEPVIVPPDIDEDAILCGYCQPGQIMAAMDLLARKPKPSDKDIDGIGNLCRCGSYPRIRSAIKRASKAMQGKAK